MAKQYQQGDVLFIPVEHIPKEANRLAGNCIVLAKGETTGHAHVITDTKSAVAYELNGEMFLKVLAPVVPQHEEHKGFPVEAGVYKIGQVRELDWLEGMERKVID